MTSLPSKQKQVRQKTTAHQQKRNKKDEILQTHFFYFHFHTRYQVNLKLASAAVHPRCFGRLHFQLPLAPMQDEITQTFWTDQSSLFVLEPPEKGKRTVLETAGADAV